MRTANISIVAEMNAVTVRWNVTVAEESDAERSSRDEIYTLIRRISIRPFGTDNVTRLFVLEDFNVTSLSHRSPPSPRYYSLNNLTPNTAYIVCFETLPDPEEEEAEQRAEARTGRKAPETDSRNACWETSTLNDETGFPVAEVATAAAVSTSTTFFVAVVCCCCFPSLCKKKKDQEADQKSAKKKDGGGSRKDKDESVNKDENDNEDQPVQPKLRAHLSRRRQRRQNDGSSRTSASPVRSTSLPPSTSSFEPELQSIAITKSDEEVKADQWSEPFSLKAALLLNIIYIFYPT